MSKPRSPVMSVRAPETTPGLGGDHDNQTNKPETAEQEQT